MKFETVKDLDDEKFRRLTGVKRPTFDKMVDILGQSIKTRKTTSGRKRKLSLENSLLMTLEYIRPLSKFALLEKIDDFSRQMEFRKRSNLIAGIYNLELMP